VGNKADLRVREVTYEDASGWAENRGYAFKLICAKDCCLTCTETLYTGIANLLELEEGGNKNDHYRSVIEGSIAIRQGFRSPSQITYNCPELCTSEILQKKKKRCC
jgi:hypothetical protein